MDRREKDSWGDPGEKPFYTSSGVDPRTPFDRSVGAGGVYDRRNRAGLHIHSWFVGLVERRSFIGFEKTTWVTMKQV